MADSDDVIPPIPTPPADLNDSPMVPPIEPAPVAPASPQGAAVPVEPAPVAPAAPEPASAYGAAPGVTPPPPAQPASAPQPTYPAQPGYVAQPGYPVQPGYAQPYATQPAGPAQGLAITSMVLGIVGVLFFGWGFPISLAAVITGHMAQKRQPWAKPFWITGLITGYVGLGISVIGGLALVAYFIAIAAAINSY